MDKFEELEWCDTNETLDDILKNPKVNLPQLVKLISEVKFTDSKVSLKSGNVLNILAKRTASYLNGVDSHGKNTSFSACCPYAVKLQVSSQNEIIYNSLTDLVNSDPLPKFVEVTKLGGSENEHSIAVCDVLKVIIVEKTGSKSSFVHFRNSSGKHIKIDVNEDVSFKVAANYSSNISLKSLFEKHREMPITVQFSKQKSTPKSYLELGTITLNSVCCVDVVVSSAIINDSEYAVVFPLNSNFRFKVTTKLKLANDKGYRDLCESLSKVNAGVVCNYLDQITKQSDNKYIIKYKKLQKQVAHCCKKDTEKVSTTKGHNEIQGTIDQISKSKNKDTGNVKLKQKSGESTKKKEKKEKESKHKKEKAPLVMEENIYITPQMTLPPNTNEQLDSHEDQWTLLLKKKVKKVYEGTKLKNHKVKKGKSRESLDKSPAKSIDVVDGDNDLYVAFNENLYCELNYESLDLINQARRALPTPARPISEMFTEPDLIPPPLPGNHPHQEKIPIPAENMYLAAVDCKAVADATVKNFFDTVQLSSVEISIWGIEDVGNNLSKLGLGKYRKVFEDSLVDGTLLLDLDETVLIDLGLSLFEARKLRKFVFGWRSGKMRPETYPVLKGFSSDDPFDWNIQDTVSHMRNIDITEMAEFCDKNQVDGELLKDICVDESIMASIISSHDKKLKIVKIKNYVIDHWRPKKIANYSTSLSKIVDSTSSKENIKLNSTVKSLSKMVDPTSSKENIKLNSTVKSKSVSKIVDSTSSKENIKLKSTVMRSTSSLYGKRCPIEEKKNGLDAPLTNIARMKQQLEEKSNNWESRKKAY